MRLIAADTDVETLDRPVRRESAALRLLRSGELGAHLLRLAEGAATEHLAREAQEEGAGMGAAAEGGQLA